MKITKKTDYGLRAISELAKRREGAISIGSIAEKHGIPDSFLEKIMQELRQAGLVEATHGRGGGYCLSRPPREISLRDVIHVLEGPVALVICLDPQLRCRIEQGCPTNPIWTLINDRFEDSLARLTLEDIVAYELKAVHT